VKKRQRQNTAAEIRRIRAAAKAGKPIEFTTTSNPEGLGFIDWEPCYGFYFRAEDGITPMFYRVKKVEVDK